MARQRGLLKISGDVDGIGFFERGGKYYLRKSNPVDGKRIKNDPEFARTRENNNEFGMTHKAVKLLRDTIRPMTVGMKDGTVSNRLHTTLSAVKNLDTTGTRGNRNVTAGLTHPLARQEIRGFNFNSAMLSSVLFKAWDIDPATGIVTIPDVIPANDIVFPQGATHVNLSGGWAKVDFVTGETELVLSNVVTLTAANTSTNITLTPASPPALATGTSFYMLLIGFSQELNGVQYLLKNGTRNALSIIEID